MTEIKTKGIKTFYIDKIRKRSKETRSINTFVCAYYKDSEWLCATKTLEFPKFKIILKGKEVLKTYCFNSIYIRMETNKHFFEDVSITGKICEYEGIYNLRVFILTGDLLDPNKLRGVLYSRYLYAIRMLILNPERYKGKTINFFHIPECLKKIIEYICYDPNKITELKLPIGIKKMFGFTDNNILNSEFCKTLGGILNKYYHIIKNNYNVDNICAYMLDPIVENSNMFYLVEEISYCMYFKNIPSDILELIYETCIDIGM